MIQSINSSTYNLIKAALDASSARGKVISNNVSNINTPNFKASNVVFEDKLNEISNENSVILKTTNKRHISDGDFMEDGYEVVKDESTVMRSDGNNVDLDKEMVSLSQNTLYYNFLTSRVNGKISSQRYIISEGRK